MTPPPFTFGGFKAGAIGAGPMIPGVILFGLSFGVISGTAGLTPIEAALMSAWVNAGTAQMASMQAWSDPVPILAVFLTTLAMNARYLLLGATLRPWLHALPPVPVYASLFGMGDGNWTLAMRERQAGRDDAAILLGSGAAMWVVWISATTAGNLFGRALSHPERFGVDFILVAFFAVMVPAFLRRRRDLAPLLVAVAAALLVERLIDGPFYIMAGAMAGSLAGALRFRDAR